MLNLNRGVLDVCAVRAPGLGDVRRAFLEDICTFTGARPINSNSNPNPNPDPNSNPDPNPNPNPSPTLTKHELRHVQPEPEP